MTRPSKFAPDFKARAIDLYRTSEGRTITAPYTSTGSPAPVCVDVAGRPPILISQCSDSKSATDCPSNQSQTDTACRTYRGGRYPVTAPDKAESALHRSGYVMDTGAAFPPGPSALATGPRPLVAGV